MKLVYGVGINDSVYKVTKHEMLDGKQKTTWRCPFYVTWGSMLERCYSERLHQSRPTYKGCTVCTEWLSFNSFRCWMIEQHHKGMQLDKDFLVEGNKVYSPDTCIFIHTKVNTFITDSCATRGEYLIGCYWDKHANKFKSRCNNPFTKKLQNLGYFSTELAAHEAWHS